MTSNEVFTDVAREPEYEHEVQHQPTTELVSINAVDNHPAGDAPEGFVTTSKSAFAFEDNNASLTRVYNWRQSMKVFKAAIETMEERASNEALKHLNAFDRWAVQGYYARQIEQAQLYIDNDEKQRNVSIHHDDERDTVAGSPVADDADAPLVRGVSVVEVEEDDEQKHAKLINLVTRCSLLLNIVLFGLKVFLVIRSGSMAFIASLVDSALDLFSGAVMVMVAYAIAHSKEHNYPTGKHKFESIGTLVFACAMFIASAKIIEECVYSLVDVSKVSISMSVPDYIVIAFVILSKGFAFLLLRRCSDVSASIEAIADDDRNDVLTNSVAVLAVFGARYLSKYIDPAVGMATAFFMMYNWACTAYEQATALSGQSAPAEYVNAITMLARNHDPRVIGVDTVRAVTSGSGHMVEIDLLVPRGMLIEEAHDIGERLQVFLENCEDLEITRAYVHIDYETTHNPALHR